MARTYSYTANGAAAVDLYSTRFDQSAAVQLPQGLPEEQPLQQPQRQPKRFQIARFTVIGTLVSVFLLMMVVQAHVRVYQNANRRGELQGMIVDLDEQISNLQSEYNSKIDLQSIETQARAMGMRKPSNSQIVYLSIAGSDNAEVLAKEEPGAVKTLVDSIVEGVRGLLSYFG